MPSPSAGGRENSAKKRHSFGPWPLMRRNALTSMELYWTGMDEALTTRPPVLKDPRGLIADILKIEDPMDPEITLYLKMLGLTNEAPESVQGHAA